MKIAYFDCFSGISGDMCLGALVDAGVSLAELKKRLKGLPLKGYGLSEKKVVRSGIASTKVSVKAGEGGARQWKDVREIINRSTLSPRVKEQGLEIFRSLFEAEARVHGVRYDKAHLHELGAVDALVDVAGTLVCLEMLGIERVYFSPVNVGGGTVRTEHGLLPVPAPATAELLKGIPVYSTGQEAELATPTGAAIIKGVGSGFGAMPAMRADAIGMGAGERELKDRPNVLRVFIGEAQGPAGGGEVTVIETNIDDMNPQVHGYLMETLLRKGALDVYLTQVVMKKGRPGVKLTVLSSEETMQGLMETLFKETTTLGLRFWRAQRTVLPRTVKTVETEFGRIRVKETVLGDGTRRRVPEYEDCKKAAKKHKIPLVKIMDMFRDMG